MLERVLGDFDEKSLAKKVIGSLIGAIVFYVFMWSTGTIEEPILYFFFSFWFAAGIIYGINVMRVLMSGSYVVEGFMAKSFMFIFAFGIGIIAGGVFCAIDILRGIIYLVMKKKEEK